MRIITTAVIKGGTGKTTTAAALAQAAAFTGKKVLAIDLDPQANLTFIIGADPTDNGAYRMLTGTNAEDLIQHTEQGIDVIAASPDLATIKTYTGSAKRLQTALMPIKKLYDVILIDTPPTMGELTFNALLASTGLLIPLEADPNSIQGMYQILDIANHLKKSNEDLTITGIVISRYDNRAKISRYMRDEIDKNGSAAGAPLLMAISRSVSITEAQAMKQSIFNYAPTSKPAQDYLKLFKIIMEE